VPIHVRPSGVRLQLIDDCTRVLRNAEQERLPNADSTLLSGFEVALSAPAQGPLIVRPWHLAIEQDELPDDVIKAGPKIVYGVAEQYSPAFCIGFLAEVDGERVAARFLVEMLGFRIRVSIGELRNLAVEGLHVFESAPMLGAGAVE
jgi:hypothetical protein